MNEDWWLSISRNRQGQNVGYNICARRIGRYLKGEYYEIFGE